MKRTLLAVLTFLTGLALAPAFAGSQSALASTDKPHANLRFNGGYQGRRLIGLYLFSIDGQRVFKRDEPLVRLKPGHYKLKFRAEGLRNRGHVPSGNPAIPGSTHWRQTKDTIEVTLKAGKTYFIAAKPHGNGAWSAVVWKKTK
jgi:hypothetical protein